MNEQELYTILSNIHISESPLISINVAYDHFVDKVVPPFILYRNTDTTTYKADDSTYLSMNQYIVDLVTEIKDTSLETKVESVLNSNHLPFNKVEDYIAEERIYQIRYYI